MEVKRILAESPFFSICIPQFNRTSFLIEACKSLAAQTFKDFEVCISDDCSTDGREKEIVDFLDRANIDFFYRKNQKNVRYDANLRSSIELARGRYCFLLGNDDGLASPNVLENVHAAIEYSGPVGVVLTNYKSFSSGRQFHRVRAAGIAGRGPWVAARNYRNLSFVSGVLIQTQGAKKYATNKWDGSEMYQMYIGCHILAEGAALLGIDEITILEGIRLPGGQVDSYARRPVLVPCPIKERKIPLVQMGRLVVDAIAPAVSSRERSRLAEMIFLQLLVFPYLFWVFEYRSVQSWNYAAGICLGMRPRNLLQGVEIHLFRRMRLIVVYAVVSAVGLFVPVRWFRVAYPLLYSVAKTVFSGGEKKR